ncbi:fimbrial protein [Klebsiella aerogenes]|uniref:fimbrial protein n=1 Tax=Klebsiella aerogenes TaxID=548 RepID=UPI00069C2826|nr:fimbrial protein [Klebsiella aerogenes]
MKTIRALLLICGAFYTGIFPVRANTEIKFSGELVSQPCRIAADNEEQSVEFGDLILKGLIAQHRSPPARFVIRLKECNLALGSQVKVTFQGESDARNPGAFAVTGDVSGVAIVINDWNGIHVKPNTPAEPVQLTEGNTQLDWLAYVQVTDASLLNEGAFSAIVTFAVNYE